MRAILIVSLFAMAYGDVKDIESSALALKAKGDAAGALAAFEEAARLEPKSARYQDEIGFLLAVLGRRGEAVEHFKHAIELDPQYAPAEFHLGAAYWLSSKDATQAIPHLERAVELDPSQAAYQARLGEALESSGQS